MYKPAKLDYTKLPRKQITTTINTELHKKFQTLSINIDEPTSKMFDVLLMSLFSNEENIENFISQVKEYNSGENDI
jgi:hypothetical protein